MRVLVTGGAGFIGSHVAEALLARGHEVRALDNLDPQVHGPAAQRPARLPSDVELIIGEVRDRAALARALDGIDAVVHLAAAVGVGQSMYQVEHYIGVNSGGTATLWELLIERRDRIRKVVVASSNTVYGEGLYACAACGPLAPRVRPAAQLQQGRWEIECPRCGALCQPSATPETKLPAPQSPYALTKYDQERLCLLLGRAYGIPAVALRLFNVYGPGQSLSNPYTGAAAIFACRALNGQSPVIYEDGLQTRDLVHVRDIARAVTRALESEVSDEVFNLGTGQPTGILELAAKICERLGANVRPQVVGKFRAGDIRHCTADLTRANAVLGFEPTISLDQGLDDLLDWAHGQEAADRFATAERELTERGLSR